MSLFGSLMADVEDDPLFGTHIRQMRQMQSMMSSMMDPFGMLGMPLTAGGPRHSSSLMPYMPQMPTLNRIFPADLSDLGEGSSFTSRTVVMSNGPNGKPQVYSSTSSTKYGPNGMKETRKTLQDSRTGTKKMSIGHHIGERAHLIEREQNVYSGDAEERQEFINLEEEEADDFDREFQVMAGVNHGHADDTVAALRAPPRLALPAPPPAVPSGTSGESRRRPQPRRPLRATASPLATASSTSVREVYAGAHPQRHRLKHHKQLRHAPADY